jgi:hypothetical protein
VWSAKRRGLNRLCALNEKAGLVVLLGINRLDEAGLTRLTKFAFFAARTTGKLAMMPPKAELRIVIIAVAEVADSCMGRLEAASTDVNNAGAVKGDVARLPKVTNREAEDSDPRCGLR